MINCPACAGPEEVRVNCATCEGAMEVSQDVFDTFMVQKAEQEKTNEFWNVVQEFMYKPGDYVFMAEDYVFELKSSQ